MSDSPDIAAPRIELAEILLEHAPTPFWRALRQVGIDRAVGVLPRHHVDWREARVEMPWDYAPLAVYQQLLAEEGFSLDVIEDNPPMDALRLGGPGRDEELEQFLRLVRTMGRLGIPVLCYNWMAVFGWTRTSSRIPGRAGAAASGFDARCLRDAPPPPVGVVAADDLVRNLRWFLERVGAGRRGGGRAARAAPRRSAAAAYRGIDRIFSTRRRLPPAVRAASERGQRHDAVPGQLHADDATICRR